MLQTRPGEQWKAACGWESNRGYMEGSAFSNQMASLWRQSPVSSSQANRSCTVMVYLPLLPVCAPARPAVSATIRLRTLAIRCLTEWDALRAYARPGCTHATKEATSSGFMHNALITATSCFKHVQMWTMRKSSDTTTGNVPFEPCVKLKWPARAIIRRVAG